MNNYIFAGIMVMFITVFLIPDEIGYTKYKLVEVWSSESIDVKNKASNALENGKITNSEYNDIKKMVISDIKKKILQKHTYNIQLDKD